MQCFKSETKELDRYMSWAKSHCKNFDTQSLKRKRLNFGSHVCLKVWVTNYI